MKRKNYESLFPGMSAPVLIFGSAVLAAVSNVISFRLSVQFYANRRYGLYD